MFVRLIYASTAANGVDVNEFKRILSTAQVQNMNHDLTGMLAFNSQYFLQALEGDRTKVNQLYTNLMHDRRHSKVAIIGFKEIEQRFWAQWSMGYASPNSESKALYLKYSTQGTFNPYIFSAESAEKLLLELTNKVVQVR